MVNAFESALRQGSEDDKAWQRTRSQLYAEPPEVRKERLAATKAGLPAAATPARVGMSLAAVEALLGAAAREDSMYGT